ncbi:arsenite efflux membrane protein ArsB [Micromonospora pisi]|uniref:Arsenite efflux membrane protein ArsB n=1 Tax=Micromonospora pisi TaxID=589240 RepID=A0A495JF51_9ACTN|nr:SLC13 family permease [Micromonospora pisi]RKR87475.1 arsenite efflux membrane protein ArsB [Micromonospora pisi]
MTVREVPATPAGTAQRRPDPAPRHNPLRRLDWSGWLALGLLTLGLVALATGLVPAADADATLRRIAPILVFLFAVLILAELAARAEFFDVLAARMAIVARGSYPALFGLSVALAALTTMILNLDTTAVLLTPVMLAVATRAGIAPLPLAMTTIWLANTASLLLPVSNLTNLLAAERIGLPVLGFAGRMALPQLAALLATAVCLWLLYWRRGLRPERRFQPPPRYRPRDRTLFRVAALTCGFFVLGILVGVPIEAVSVLGAVVLLVAFAVRDRAALRWQLVPWRLVALVGGMFLIVDAVGRLGLSRLLSMVVGADPGVVGVWRSAAAGGLLANLVNNLPAYVATEAVVPLGHTDQLLGLLIGTNAGPLVLPWASLATLLWLERCRAAGLRPHWPRFLRTGALTAAVTVAAAVTVLLLER